MNFYLTKKSFSFFFTPCLLFGYSIFTRSALAAYNIEIGIPGTSLTKGASVSDPSLYIQQFFVFGLILAGFLAVGAIVVGGIMYMMGGTVTSVEKAKAIIIGAVSGVLLLLCSYLILATIDPTLTNLSPFKLPNATIPQTQTITCGAGQILNPLNNQCEIKPAEYDTPACQPGGACTPGKCVPGGSCHIDIYTDWDPVNCICIQPGGRSMNNGL